MRLQPKNKYYLISQWPELSEICEKYRFLHIEHARKIEKYIESVGATAYCIGFSSELIGLCFHGKSRPDGLLKPKSGKDICFPMRGKAGDRWRKDFEALGKMPYFPEFIKGVLSVPHQISYKTEKAEGSFRIGSFPEHVQPLWYSKDSPICLILPDVIEEVAHLKACYPDAVFTNPPNIEDWKPPAQLTEILPEEWQLMVARHKAAAKG